ncbi:MAG: hypothetical protein JSR12_12170 [Bacteroidetes bacterium]|nr:hypothetical protein [Bacteroidota bacterium]
MNFVHKILLISCISLFPFVMLNAQKTTKKKKATTTATKKIASKKKSKKTTARRKTKANTKNEQTNAANPMGETIRMAEKQNTENKDTLTPRVVNVTSAFKPVLKNAAKINFTAATPVFDSSKIDVTYNIPSHNLFFNYQPVAIKAIAYQPDSASIWSNNQYIKIGYGNYASPHIEAGATFGNPKTTTVNLHAKYLASNGNLPFQDYNKTNIDANINFNISEKNELIVKGLYYNNNQYKYGFTTGSFTKDQLQQQFNLIGGSVALHSKGISEYGITYHPEINVSNFTDNRNANEFSVLIKAPINKSFGKSFAFDLSATADLSKLYQPTIALPYTNLNNNLFYINPTLQFKADNFKINAGIQPSWDNNSFSMLPNVSAEIKLNEEKKLVGEIGWVGSFTKNTYRSLTEYNPFIAQPGNLLNTKNIEQYIGIKGSTGNHFTYNARFSLLKVNNLALLTNDTATNNSQTFVALFEPELQGIKLHGEIGYTWQEKIFATASINYTNYTQQQQYNKAWGIIPIEVNGTLRYKITKDFVVKGDLFFWDGAYYRNPQTLATSKLPVAIDLNAGAEYTIAKRLNLWLQMNNVFNNKYQRWNQYQVLGFNFLTGVVYSFH